MSTSNTFQFLLSWLLILVILTLANRTRFGHVLIYYALLLMIFFILAVEYKQLVPIFSGLKTIGEANNTATQTQSTPVDTTTPNWSSGLQQALGL